MLHINVRLPKDVVDHFKEFPSYTKEMRRVLEAHVKEAEREVARKVAINQQRWQDILAEENEGE
jgi:NAD kinase